VKNILKKNILSQIPCFKKKIQQNFKKLKRFARNCHNCLQHERVLKIFYFRTLNSAKTWLNKLMDDCQLSNIENLEKKKSGVTPLT
jgi:hypothetical protein